jgi:hypothetical protein
MNHTISPHMYGTTRIILDAPMILQSFFYFQYESVGEILAPSSQEQ